MLCVIKCAKKFCVVPMLSSYLLLDVIEGKYGSLVSALGCAEYCAKIAVSVPMSVCRFLC